MKFKKIATVLGSALMVGSTMGLAAAAAYPAPFVSNGVADVAIVYGTNGAATADYTAAMDISANLNSALAGQAVGGVKTVTGGDSFKLEKSSANFNFGEQLDDIYSSLDKDELKVFLAEGTYKEGGIDTEYTQTIALGNQNMSLFADKSFKNDAPTIGWMFEDTSGSILNYTIDFKSAIDADELNGTSMPLLGKEYYVLSNDNTTNSEELVLLDSANKKILADGEKITVDGKEVSVDWIDTSYVRLNINGELTDKIAEGGSFQLSDDSYVVVTDIMSSSRESTVQKVEFSLGAGKIILRNGEEVIIGEDKSENDVNGLIATIANDFDSITLSWTADEDLFLAEGSPIVMPGLGVLGITFDGLNYPSTSEKISVENGEVLTLMMDNFDLPLLELKSDVLYQGEQDYPLIIANDSYTYAEAGFVNGTTAWFDGQVFNNTVGYNVSMTMANGLNLSKDDKFIVTVIDTDLSDVKTLYYRVTGLKVDSADDYEVVLTSLIEGDKLTFNEDESEVETEDVTVTLVGFSEDDSSAFFEFTTSNVNGAIAYNKAVSKTGLVVSIPTRINNTAASEINFTEANEDGDVEDGITTEGLTVSISDNDKLYVQYTGSKEEVSSDKYLAVVNSKLASKISADESNDEYDFEIEYFGAEVTADVMVTAGGVVTESDSGLGALVVKDSEADKMTGKNLIVVGGNCVNSVAASLLGLSAGATCASDFAKTGAADGKFLIKSFDKAGKIALLVAGYSAADTTKAKLWLVNNKVDSEQAKKGLVGTGVNAADVVVA